MTALTGSPVATRSVWLKRRIEPLWLAAPGLLFLAVFLAYPALQLLQLSLQDPDTGEFSTTSYERAFTVGVYARVLAGTFTVAAQTTIFCLLFGYPLAYWLSRLPADRQRAMVLLVLLPFWTSALVKNFAWLMLLGRTGIVANAARWFGIENPPELLFSRATVVFAMTHTMLPLAVVTMLPVMSKINPRLLAAAQTLGATRAEAFWRIFFHLSIPGVAAAGLLVFIGSIGFFITPALLGGPRETLMGQVIIDQILQLQNWSFAGALASVLIATALLTCIAFHQLFGLSSVAGSQAAAVTSRSLKRSLGLSVLGLLGSLFRSVTGFFSAIVGSRNQGWVLPVYSGAVIAILLVPVVAIIPVGFTSSTFISFPPPGFSLRWLVEYLDSPVWMGATARSFAVGAASATLTIAIASLGAFGVVTTKRRAADAIFLMFLMPMVMPTIITAVGLFYLCAQLSLVATDISIIIGHTLTSIPIAFVILVTAFRTYDFRLDQAAYTLGANRRNAFLRVTLPLLTGGFAAAFIFSFVHSFEELTVAIFLGGGLKSTLPKQMWDDVLLQVSPTLAAASAVVILVVTSLFLIAEYLRYARTPRP